MSIGDVTMRITRWRSDLLVMPHEDDASLFEGRRYLALYDPAEGLILTPDCWTGATLNHIFQFDGPGRHRDSGEYWAYRFKISDARRPDGAVANPRTWAGLEALPPFAVHEAEFEEADGGDLQWRVPPTHLLPWPFSDPHSAMGHYKPTHALEDLTVRVRSAHEAGVSARDFVAEVPGYVKSRILAEDWNRMIDTFRGEKT